MRQERAGGEKLTQLEKELPLLAEKVAEGAAELTRLRERSRKKLEKVITGELGSLGLAGSRFEISLSHEETAGEGIDIGGEKLRVDERGVDRAEFLFSANPGEKLKPLARVASGGELSRIMLAVKSVLSAVDMVPTLIFDEVDIGIGGKVARLAGDRLNRLSEGRQVFCVTHLPQIASLANSHYNITKKSQGGRVKVSVKMLDEKERSEEVARMLGGSTITLATRRHAAEMLKEGRQGL